MSGSYERVINAPYDGELDNVALYLNFDVEETSMYGRSDTSGFRDDGWATGGVFTGAEGIQTDEQAAIYGGTAGMAYDPCSPQACDSYGNVDHGAFAVMLDAAAVGILQHAMNTEDGNGVPARPGFTMDRFELNVSAALAR